MSGTEAIGRAVRKGRAAGRRPLGALRGGLSPVTRVIAGVVLTGTAAVVLVSVLLPGPPEHAPVVQLSWLHGVALLAALILLTAVSELVAVRLRRQDASEELTLLDPMILLNVLLLPPREALSASLAGIALAYLIRRRTPVKALFNLGTYATAASLMVVLTRATAGSSPDFDPRLVAALALGAAGFVAVNVGALSCLFSTMGAGRVLTLVREDLRSAAFTLTATVALTAMGVALAAHTPVLLPFVVLPAAAITYAYRATATEAEERDRSARVLAFSQVLASSPERDIAVTAFLRLAREGFYADEVLAVMGGDSVLSLGAADGAEPRALAPTDEIRRLAGRAAEGAAVLVEGLPAGWSGALVAPLEAGGGRMGTVVIGRSGRNRFMPQDLSVLTPLASALAAALRNAEHVAQLVEESSKLRSVVEQSSDGILVLDSSGVVQLWNPALERLSGWSEADAIGARLGDLFETQDLDGNPVDAFEVGLQSLSAVVRQVAVDLTLVRKDGERRSVRFIHAATFDAFGLVRDVVNVHDLTKQRQVEKLKSDFVATVSHELRTPVTPIKGYADLLRRKGDSMTPEKRAKALDVICDRAAHLARLVEDLLLASNVSAEKEPARAVVMGSADLAQLTTRATEDFAPAAGRLRLHLPDGPVDVSCDPMRAVQVLTNLVSNALKYSPDDSPVDVEVSSVDGRGRVTVVDRGRGLPADQLEQIFEKFHRVEDPMVMSTSGTGLGLYIARHLARAMAGDLEVTSTLGQGSTFTFHLPLAPPAGTATPAAEPEPRGTGHA
jgi:PAS domain S-box-containing protein